VNRARAPLDLPVLRRRELQGQQFFKQPRIAREREPAASAELPGPAILDPLRERLDLPVKHIGLKLVGEELGARKAELEQSAARLRERLALLDRDYRKVAEQLAGLQTAPHPGVSVVSSYGPSATQPTGSAETNQQGLPSLIAGTVELPPIIVRKDRAGMSIPVRGRLVEVNEPHAFVVLDKGSLDGVHVGMVFDVVRGSSTVGRATVVRVRPQLSACDVLRQHTVGPLQSGDEVVQRSP